MTTASNVSCFISFFSPCSYFTVHFGPNSSSRSANFSSSSFFLSALFHGRVKLENIEQSKVFLQTLANTLVLLCASKTVGRRRMKKRKKKKETEMLRNPSPLSVSSSATNRTWPFSWFCSRYSRWRVTTRLPSYFSFQKLSPRVLVVATLSRRLNQTPRRQRLILLLSFSH